MPTKQPRVSPATKAPREKAAPKKRVVAKKVAAKKTATVKRVAATAPATRAKKATKPPRPVVAQPEHSFWTTDGQIFRSLHELAVAFGSMDETVFVYHANEAKNDFAEWVEHVLEDQACAADLRKAKNPKKAQLVTLKHVSLYPL